MKCLILRLVRFLSIGFSVLIGSSLSWPAEELADPERGRAPGTLEDLFGDTGNSFQASIGLLNLEGGTNPANQGFGLAIDDMFIEWFEFTLDPDSTQCSNGLCAVLDMPSGLLYEGVTSVPVSLLDSSPYGSYCNGGADNGQVCFAANGNSDCPGGGVCVPSANDCDLNGLYNDPGDDFDCNDNGVNDVVVLATSEVDRGEIIVLDRVALNSPEYRGIVAVSVLADSDGVLYLAQIGADDPTVIATYIDNDDGTGQICQNDVVPDSRGRVQAFVRIVIQFCDVALVSTSFADNGDGDLYADSQETIDLDFSLQNNCGFPLTNCVARLSSNSPEVECIKTGTVALGDLPASTSGPAPIFDSPSPFVFKLDDFYADRTSLGLTTDDALSAEFNVAISCTEIDGLTSPQDFSMTLDLNLNDNGQTPGIWKEDFEAGGTNPSDPMQGTAFVAQNNDRGLPGTSHTLGLQYSAGWRCQYNDPDWVNGSAYNHPAGIDCYPGLNLAHANAVFWQVDGSLVAGTPDGGRAYRGTKSMYYGIFLGAADENFTTPLGTVEAAGTTGFINLGSGNPQLSFWQQISLADNRTYNTDPMTSVDRGVTQIKLYDDGGTEISPWMNLQPLQNFYDQQAYRNYFNCTFDPIDDGNTEDDFFDPTDPDRDMGPSSTCYPTFIYANMGSTTGAFSVSNIGYATTPPASSDEPTLGVGTWVQSKVDLSQFRGRRAKLRFLVASLKAGGENHVALWGEDLDEREDGWWLDDIIIDEVLSNPAFFENDDFIMGQCSVSGAACLGHCKYNPGTPCTDDGQCLAAGDYCLLPCPAGQTCDKPGGLPNPPGCGEGCTAITANAWVTPEEALNPGTVTTPVPGQAVTVNGAAPPDVSTGAIPSVADSCLSGNLQFQFCRDGDPLGDGPNLPDASCDDPEDLILRSWTENSVITVAPQATAGYTMEVRCSTATTCVDFELINIDVTCPGSPNALGLKALRWSDKNTLEWSGPPLWVDYWIGDEFTVQPGFWDYPGTTFTAPGTVNSLDISQVPSPGAMFGVLVMIAVPGELNTIPIGYFCNSVTWRSGGAAEIPEGEGAPVNGDPPAPIGRDRAIGKVYHPRLPT